MNDKEFIIKFYSCDNEEQFLKDVYHNLRHLQQESQQLKGNWKQLKEYVEETKIKEFEKTFGKRYNKTFTQAEIIVCNMIKNKMKELERGVSDEN